MTSRRRGRPLSPEEEALWQRATAADKPIKKQHGIVTTEAKHIPRHKLVRREPALHLTSHVTSNLVSPAPTSPGSSSMDANLANKLRRGRLPIEGVIDLHGATLMQAEDMLNRYIAGAAAMGKRCILVITGKGVPPPQMHERDYMPARPRPGAIRTALPQWLKHGPHASRILAHHPAVPRDGGSGAFYVLLRRQR